MSVEVRPGTTTTHHLLPLTLITITGGGGGWQLMAPMGGAGEKFSNYFLHQNELKGPKNNMSFLLFFLLRLGG